MTRATNSDDTILAPGWGHRVAISFGVKVQLSPAAADDPLQKLCLMKDVIREMCDVVEKERWASRRSRHGSRATSSAW